VGGRSVRFVPGLIDDLLDVKVEALPRGQLLDTLDEIERAKAQLDGRAQHVLARLLDGDSSGKEYVVEEVATALRIAPQTAQSRMHAAVEYAQRFPKLLASLATGETTLLHLRAVAEAARGLDDARAGELETRVLERAETMTVGEFRAAAKRVAARLDPRGEQQRHEAAAPDRRIEYLPQDDGMASLWVYLAATDAAAVMARVDATARASVDEPGAERTTDQKRVDAFVDLVTSGASGGTAKPLVSVTVADTTLLGLDDQPAELAGYGPITATVARRLADEPGCVLRRLPREASPLRQEPQYEPSNRLNAAIIARDGTCRFPGCRRRADRCEIDHIIARRHGGPTVDWNLHALCRRHHHLKHEAGWKVRRRPDGTTEWTSPTGQTYDKPPDGY
jgi:hypothetical protein